MTATRNESPPRRSSLLIWATVIAAIVVAGFVFLIVGPVRENVSTSQFDHPATGPTNPQPPAANQEVPDKDLPPI